MKKDLNEKDLPFYQPGSYLYLVMSICSLIHSILILAIVIFS